MVSVQTYPEKNHTRLCKALSLTGSFQLFILTVVLFVYYPQTTKFIMVARVIVSTDNTQFHPPADPSSLLRRRKLIQNGATTTSQVDTSSHTSSSSDYSTSMLLCPLEEDRSSSSTTLKSILKIRTHASSLAREWNHRNNDTTTTTTTTTTPKNVGFGSIKISSHDIILGDNPAVSNGLPIAIAWKRWEEITLESVLEYDAQRTREPRRSGELVLPASVRETILASITTRSERTEMAQQIAKIQSSRRKHAKSKWIWMRRRCHFTRHLSQATTTTTTTLSSSTRKSNAIISTSKNNHK
jgi:hypothetical protein